MTTGEPSRAAAVSPALQPNSPPTKASLANWWERFKKRSGKDGGEKEPQDIFGVPLQKSINYANVAISLNDENGEPFVYGYIPIVVAKCGVFLKEKATDVEGIFRLSGSAKRIKDLQAIFDSPEKYGKGLDWTGYTVHDAAAILRRYLNQLPEPIIPLEFYNRFRSPLTVDPERFSDEAAVTIYQKLISELPPLNRQLLLYILDLLAVFASKSEHNRMTAVNLAAIFQPGLISHPSHEMAPQAYKLSQDVLVFLITHQDHFLMKSPATNEIPGQSPITTTPSSLRHSKTVVARSPSNSSAGADDVRKYGNLRRNVSVSSKKSASPASKSGGVSRSNTLPSKRSPRTRHQPTFRPTDGASSPKPYGSEETVTTTSAAIVGRVPSPNGQMMEDMTHVDAPTPEDLGTQPKEEHRSVPGSRHVSGSSQNTTPVTSHPKERNFANIFSLAPGEPDRPQRKLRKRRMPGSSDHSAESSTTSLPFASGPASPDHSLPGSPPVPIPIANTAYKAHPSGTTSAPTLLPMMSPTPSATSSVTSQEDSSHSYSDATNTSTSPGKKKKARSTRWLWSNSKVDQWNPGSPTFPGGGSSNISLAERIRLTSRSPPVGDYSEGSGEDDSKSGRGPLGWLKKRSERKQVQDVDNRDNAPLAPIQAPGASFANPGSPIVQPPTPSSPRQSVPIPREPTPSSPRQSMPVPREAGPIDAGSATTPEEDAPTPRQSAAIPEVKDGVVESTDENRTLTPEPQLSGSFDPVHILPDADVVAQKLAPQSTVGSSLSNGHASESSQLTAEGSVPEVTR